MTTYTDEELVALAKQDKKYLEELIVRYRLFVSRLTCNYVLSSYNEEDFFQEGLIALCNAVKSFESDKHVLFSTYATVCIKNRMKDILKSAGREKRKAQTISLDSQLEEEGGDYHSVIASDALSPEEKLLEEEKRTEQKKKLQMALSHFEYQVLMLRIEGLSYEEIASELEKKEKKAITPKMVDNALQRAKSKLENQRNKK